ncbi:U4/U6.U5 snRNP associated protein [Coemansia sp. RSA 1358]|nr:U4/U6.U5 snRNP associated protein [Coemansia umbellata]KAJ2620949.1 U4/U6.U5 snRNP associated protein [Coemansia sp. RSA 1358]
MDEEDEERRRKGLKPRVHAKEASSGARELLQARKHTINLEGMVGKTQVVQSSSAASGQPGFYCKVCDITVKDSMSYLDHINGKNHQRMLNRSMKVAAETVADVIAKLQSLREAKRRQQMAGSEYNFHEQVSKQQQIDQEKRQRRKEARRRRRLAQTYEEESVDGESIDEDDTSKMMEQMLGTASFKSTKK